MIENEQKKYVAKSLVVFLVVLSVFTAMKFLSELKAYTNEGSENVNTVSFSGHGEIEAVPDIANISFTITNDAKTVKDAQDTVAKIEKASLDFLKASKVDAKDIKTSDASFYPKYEYRYTKAVPCNEFGCPPSNGNNVIVGYTSSETITVKVRNTDDVGAIMQGIGGLGVSNLNGPNFTIDNEDGLKANARKKAIDDAKAKAEALAKDLGVKLGRIASFNESGTNYPAPMYASGTMMKDSAVMSAPAEVPKGQNTISSDVTITYELR